MRDLLEKAAAVAAADAPVLISGETGAGKEMLAGALHASSSRSHRQLVAINVAALPADLLESELFGHVKGAFTGASRDKMGLLENASGGTVLLDEVAEMPPALQAKLLRVLQDGEVRRVGSLRSVHVDVRIFSSTHRDLRARVQEQSFREDLYYRLKVLSLRVPSLRERSEDIIPLAEHFLEEYGHRSGRLTAGARDALRRYAWPGNVRELENALQHAAVVAGKRDIGIEHLPAEVVGGPIVAEEIPVHSSLADVERFHILRVLESCGGRPGDAARILGISRATLWRKLRAYGIADQSP